MKFIAIIPARYASTRFPGKPLADIQGKPMIQHVYERTSQVFEHCCVATDDTRIAEAVDRFGGCAVMTSPDHRSGTDRCAEALDKYSKTTGTAFDAVINVQGDEPFISTEHLTSLRDALDVPGARNRHPRLPHETGRRHLQSQHSEDNPLTGRLCLYFSRSVIPYIRGAEQSEWSSRHTYLKHIGIYGYRSDILHEITRLPQGMLEKAESLEQLRWLENGYRIKVGLVSSETIGIDTPEDLARLLKKMHD